jgi:hypothetical protein
MRRTVLVLLVCVLLAAVGAVSAQPVRLISETHSPGDSEARKPTRPFTISVDCTRGESVNKALEKVTSKQQVESVIEIHGMCAENVVVRGMTNLTLRGTDPEQDGITGVGQENELFPYSSALMIYESNVIWVENLTLNGWRPLRIYFSDNVNLMNCELFGVEGGRQVSWMAHSLVNFHNTTISSPGSWGVAALSSRVILNDSTVVADFIGIYSGTGASVYTENLTVDATKFAVYADEAANMWLVTTELAGDVVSSLNASVVLANDVTQTDHGSSGWNGVFERSSLQVRNGSQLLGPVYVEGFSNAVVKWGSSVPGDLECWDGGDAYCEDPASVWGAYGCPSIPWFGSAESAARSIAPRPDLSSIRRELRSMIEEEKRD